MQASARRGLTVAQAPSSFQARPAREHLGPTPQAETLGSVRRRASRARPLVVAHAPARTASLDRPGDRLQTFGPAKGVSWRQAPSTSALSSARSSSMNASKPTRSSRPRSSTTKPTSAPDRLSARTSSSNGVTSSRVRRLTRYQRAWRVSKAVSQISADLPAPEGPTARASRRSRRPSRSASVNLTRGSGSPATTWPAMTSTPL